MTARERVEMRTRMLLRMRMSTAPDPVRRLAQDVAGHGARMR